MIADEGTDVAIYEQLSIYLHCVSDDGPLKQFHECQARVVKLAIWQLEPWFLRGQALMVQAQ